MSIRSEIDRLTAAVASAYSAAIGKGATAPAKQNADNLAACIASIAFVAYRTGHGVPDDALGADGDLYFDMG